ncbi:MAG: hypothetical protein KAU17_04850 [Spirochaetales bacterium]|nr:hypothetical protein [Spirochaetales bacterium]
MGIRISNRGMSHECKTRIHPVCRKKTSEIFLKLFLIQLSCIFIAAVSYTEPFLFWKYPFSDLGASVTPHGLTNSWSFFPFVLGLISSAVILISLGRYYLRKTNLRNKYIKVPLCGTGAVGCLLAIFPHNIYVTTHVIGASLMIGSLWALAILFLIEARQLLSPKFFILGQIFLQCTVVPYAITFFSELPLKQVFQKFAVIGLYVILVVVTSAVKNAVSKSLDQRVVPILRPADTIERSAS